MLTSQRKQHLLALLRDTGQLIAKDVSRALGISEDTIRRDLRELAQEGLLQRVHGGALPSSPAVGDFARRESLTSEGKVAIGRAAAALVQPGQLIILDGGTTARQVARHLLPGLQATVVTHSPTIAVELVDHAKIEVILLGGRLFKHSIVAVGATTVDAIRGINADIYFMGVTGIHPKTGLTTGDFEEALVKRAFTRAAAETIVLASAEKLNAASPFLVVPLADASALITETDLDPQLAETCRLLGLDVHRA